MSIPTSVTLRNGEEAKVNDYVYVTAAWAGPDDPWRIARIMEFLPPKEEDKVAASRKDKGKVKDAVPPTRMRLAYCYRPQDLSDRPTSDPRLLLASIYSEPATLPQLQGKCLVAHREQIRDLAAWRRRPDRFYFARAYDPYIKKDFDVVQASAVRNIPEDVRDTLCSRYDFILAEKEIVPNLTDNLRLCDTCGDWCPHAESVQCDACKRFFHMSCVTPPLVAKPSRGYGWSCAHCAGHQPDDVVAESGGVKTRAGATAAVVAPSRGAAATATTAAAPPAPRPRGRPRKNPLPDARPEYTPAKYFRSWPFRYFGLHTVAEDTLDEDDTIFPRIATRVGPKFQGVIPATTSPDELGNQREIERGTESTVEVLSLAHSMSDQDVEQLEQTRVRLAPSEKLRSDVDWYTEVIRRLSDAYVTGKGFDSVDMKSPLRFEKWKLGEVRYIDRPWTEDEIAAFEGAIGDPGLAELRHVRQEIGAHNRSHAEVVRFYGHWKNERMREENEKKRAGTFSLRTNSPDSYSPVTPNAGGKACALCRTRTSDTWYRSPKAQGVSGTVLCDSCGLNWYKYHDLTARPVRDDGQKKAGEKREGTPLAAGSAKRPKTTVAAAPPASAPLSKRNTPPVAPSGPQMQCVACSRKGPSGKVLRCMQCKMQVHAASCGAMVAPSDLNSWVCDLCHNEKTEEASLSTDCLLCPRRKRDRNRKDLILPPPDSFLRACKPTEGQGWAHVVCAVFMPETSFTDDSRLRLVEGISAIPPQRWLQTCAICKEKGGAVVRCTECPEEYHVSCAWKINYRVGFELTPKSRLRDGVPLVKFRGETGALIPVVRCKDHDKEKAHKKLLSMCDVDEESGQSAMQIYCKTYKQAQTDLSYGLLRKARRLDDILKVSYPSRAPSEATLAEPDQQCDQCGTQYSPLFYPAGPAKVICHKCHFQTTTNGTASPMSVA